jgi:hypothetical protein
MHLLIFFNPPTAPPAEWVTAECTTAESTAVEWAAAECTETVRFLC